MVVFDGYTDTMNNAKSAEQERRNTTETLVDIDLNEDMMVALQYEHFLVNEKNKLKFIKILSRDI